MRRSHLARTAVASLIVAILYVLLARLGLSMASVGRSITLVWPPTGLSLAALFLLGRALWPGVFLGALLVNALTPGVPFLSASGMAIGNTAEAVLGATLLLRFRFDPTLRRTRDIFKLAALAGTLSTATSAIIGPLSLWLGGVVPRQILPTACADWWMGDLMGDLIVAPFLLVWFSGDENRFSRLIPEGALLLILIAAMSTLVFKHPVIFLFAAQPYAVFPLLIWAALRLGPWGSVSANLIVSGVSIWVTSGGEGPFARPLLSESLLLVQTFMAVAALTSLILGATAAERADALRAREDFISIASHEIRTPLTSLQLHIERLKTVLNEKWKAAQPIDDMSGTLSILERQLLRMSGLADVLLDLTRLRTGDLKLDLKEVDLVALLHDTAGTLTARADVPSPFEIQAEGPIVGQWDSVRLRQVVTNLLDNAMKYGGGKSVLISASANAETATLNVRDHGAGIAERDQAGIFRRFERMTADRRLPGMGLGLHIAREIVEALQGTIRVTSRPGEGATFTVTLPLGLSNR